MLALGLDLGTAIHRVTFELLSRICIAADMVEPPAQLASQAPLQEMTGPGCVGEVFVLGMDEWVPRAGAMRAGAVWAPWFLEYR